MAVTVQMQAPIGSGIGGTFTNMPSGTTYSLTGTGPVTVQQADVDAFLRQGFSVVGTLARKTFFSSPLAADLVSIVAAVQPANGALTLAAQPPHARKLQYRLVIGGTAFTAGVLTTIGFDQDGNALTEVVSLVQAATITIKSAYAWSQITSSTISGLVGTATSNTIGIGLSADFGLPTGVGVSGLAMVKSTKITWIIGTSKIAVDDVYSTGTLDKTARTFAPTTVPVANGLIDYEFSYQYQIPS